MAKIAILGFGTVGSGVWEVLKKNKEIIARRAKQPIEVKRILVRKKENQSEMFTDKIDDILNDPEITMAAEAIGGVKSAYPYVKALLESGRSVVTSNKELVASHGAELLALARKKHTVFLFEASVGGGMPLLMPIAQSLAANRICQISGIVNGTTNFMLTKMATENMDFSRALTLAQQLGYAETTDPSDDVDGLDACRKIAILASLAFGRQIHTENIPTRGIRDVTPFDMQAAVRMGGVIKLIAWARQQENGVVSAGVEPMLVPIENQLAGVDDVFNAVLAKGDMLGDTLFYGKGAGKLPTASAMVADIISAVVQGSRVHDTMFWEPAEPETKMLTDHGSATYYVRTKKIPASMLPELFGPGELMLDHGMETGYLIDNITPQKLYEAAREAKALGGCVELGLRRLEH